MGREIGQTARERQRETERENRNRGGKRAIKGQRKMCEREGVGTDRDSETLQRNRMRATREDGHGKRGSQGEKQRQRHAKIFLKTNKENGAGGACWGSWGWSRGG